MKGARFRQAMAAIALDNAEATMGPEELQAAAAEIVEAELERLDRDGRMTNVVTVRLPRTEHHALRIEALDRKLSLNELLRIKAARFLPDRLVPVPAWENQEGESDGSENENPVLRFDRQPDGRV
jgi:hypothetical protein